VEILRRREVISERNYELKTNTSEKNIDA